VWSRELFPYKVHAGRNDWPGQLHVMLSSLFNQLITGLVNLICYLVKSEDNSALVG